MQAYPQLRRVALKDLEVSPKNQGLADAVHAFVVVYLFAQRALKRRALLVQVQGQSDREAVRDGMLTVASRVQNG